MLNRLNGIGAKDTKIKIGVICGIMSYGNSGAEFQGITLERFRLRLVYFDKAVFSADFLWPFIGSPGKAEAKQENRKQKQQRVKFFHM